MANIYDLSDTWNDGGTTFNAIKMNVTDTASDAASLLMDLQVGGSSKFNVRKDGRLSAVSASILQPFDAAYGTLHVTSAGESRCAFGSASYIGWGSNVYASVGLPDVRLYRDAANTLAQRNSTNAQTFNLYNTYTNATNYERGFMKWNSNVLEIGTEADGAGTQRTVRLVKIPINTLWVESEFANYGLQFNNNGETVSVVNGTKRAVLGYGVRVANNNQFVWSPTSDATAAADTGLARSAAGVVKVTDGSTGTGELIFIVPTSDPGITGALWNNGGTLAISA